jgi:uncharacterized protein (DUF697 family)
MTTHSPLAHSSDIALIAALSGAASLVPVPFVDEKIRARLHAQMFRTVAARKGKSLDQEAVAQLLGHERGGLLGAAGKFVLLYPLRRLFRRIFGVIALNDAASEVSKTYHLGFLFLTALNDNADETHSMAEIRAAIDATLTAVDTRPVRHLFQGAVRAWSRSRTKGDSVDTAPLLARLTKYGTRHFEGAVTILRDALTH